jgi:DNA repair exonuclease SbcCD ATPase subunit
MLEFQQVRWKNFLSTGNQFTEVILNGHKTTLIVGKNGAGKSTLLDAITYALFGKPFRNINKPQLHNSITRKGLLVELEMKINGIPYLIRRGDRPGVFEVIQDGKLLNQNAKAKEYQDTLEKQIIKCNFKSFCQIVILGSATYSPFMALPAGNRREIIEDLLDLQIFTIMNKLLVQKTNDNNGAIYDSDRKKELASQKMKLIKKHLAEVQQNNDKMIIEKRDRIAATEQQIEATQHEIEDTRERAK